MNNVCGSWPWPLSVNKVGCSFCICLRHSSFAFKYSSTDDEACSLNGTKSEATGDIVTTGDGAMVCIDFFC